MRASCVAAPTSIISRSVTRDISEAMEILSCTNPRRSAISGAAGLHGNTPPAVEAEVLEEGVACVLQAALHAELARAEPGEAASSSSLKVRARELAGKFGEALQEAGWSTDRLVVDAAPARATWTCGP